MDKYQECPIRTSCTAGVDWNSKYGDDKHTLTQSRRESSGLMRTYTDSILCRFVRFCDRAFTSSAPRFLTEAYHKVEVGGTGTAEAGR